jgi:hypothetical protein
MLKLDWKQTFSGRQWTATGPLAVHLIVNRRTTREGTVLGWAICIPGLAATEPWGDAETIAHDALLEAESRLRFAFQEAARTF